MANEARDLRTEHQGSRVSERENSRKLQRGSLWIQQSTDHLMCVKKWYKDGEKQSERIKWNSVQYSKQALGIMPAPPRHGGKLHNSQHIVQNVQKCRHRTLSSISSRYWVGHSFGSPNRSLYQDPHKTNNFQLIYLNPRANLKDNYKNSKISSSQKSKMCNA